MSGHTDRPDAPDDDPDDRLARLRRSTHFEFSHKVFQIDGAYFSLTPGTRAPVYHVPLGDMNGAIALDSLSQNFGIEEGSRDWHLLEIVAKSLDFVKIIRPGESIPRELLDGSASWSVQDRHRVMASARISSALLAWLTQQPAAQIDTHQLEQLLADAETRQRVQDAIGAMARELRIPANRKQEVIDKIEAFAHELAYIEALRERYAMIRGIYGKIQQLKKVYAKERGVVADLNQMSHLFREPFHEFDLLLSQVDDRTYDVFEVMKHFARSVNLVRQIRDELHVRMLDWNEMITPWESAKLIRTPELDQLLKDTYRFLAQRYLTAKVWSRTS